MGIMLSNGTLTAVALLALWYADRRAAMINYTSGADAMSKMRAKAKLKTIITSRALLEKLNMEPAPEMIFMEDIEGTLSKGEIVRNFLQVLLVPHWILIRLIAPKSWRGVKECATILFSSGSTGLPKGVMLSHHNLNSNIISFWREIAWRSDDSVLGNLPLFHVFGLMTNFCFPAVTGTKVILYPIRWMVRKFAVLLKKTALRLCLLRLLFCKVTSNMLRRKIFHLCVW
jgi:acyl-[acyl-carrier-protein]-phospholipid O-acyltransferase/long-chain-fatty-acid--[acyl-carrier-protein] ligase